MNSLESNIIKVETAFNILGSIPVIGVFSGAARVTLGKVQFVAATVFTAISLVAALISKGGESDKWMMRAQKGANHMFHGAANVIRGLAECVLAATIGGSLIPLGIQLLSPNGFAPRLKY